jgi:hypothetical protein
MSEELRAYRKLVRSEEEFRDAIAAAVAAERERCAGIVATLQVILGSPSRAFDEAIEKIRQGRVSAKRT